MEICCDIIKFISIFYKIIIKEKVMFEKRTICLIFCVIFALTGCNILPKEEEVLAPPLVKETEIKYDTIDVIRDDLYKKIIGAGTFVSIEHQELFFKNKSGRLKVIHVKNGQEVKEGDIVAELFNEDIEKKIEMQELSIQKAKIRLDKLTKSNNKDALRVKEIDYELQKMKLKDLETRGKFEALDNQIKQQKLVVEKMKIEYDKVKNGQDNNEIKLAQIDLKTENLKLEQYKQQLKDSLLVSNVSGKVTYINTSVKKGDFVDTYKHLVSVSDPSIIQLEYSGAYNKDFKLGMEVDVAVNGNPFKGEVVVIPGSSKLELDEEDKDVVRIEVANLPKDVTMGDTVQLSVILDKRTNVIAIPRNAIQKYLGRTYVKVLEDGLTKEKDVEIGLETATKAEILEGINEGEKLVIR